MHLASQPASIKISLPHLITVESHPAGPMLTDVIILCADKPMTKLIALHTSICAAFLHVSLSELLRARHFWGLQLRAVPAWPAIVTAANA